MQPALRATIIFSMVGFLVNFGLGTVAPILPLYALTFGISVAMVGALIAASGLSKVLLDIPSSVIADRVGTKRFMTMGLLIVTLSAVISAFALDYTMLLLGIIAQGAGSAVYFTSSYIGISRTAPPTKRGGHLSIFISLQFLGTTSGPILGGFIGQAYGLRGPFLVYATFAFISALVVNFMVNEKSLQGGAVKIHLRQIDRSLKNYTLMSVNVGLMATSILRTGLVSTILPLFATRNLGLSTVDLGVVLTLSAGFNFISLFPAGSLSDRYGRKPFFFASLFLGGVVCILIPLASDLSSFAVALAVLGFTLGLSGSVGAYVSDASPPSDLSEAFGIFRTLGDFGSFIGPIILTWFIPSTAVAIGIAPFLIAGTIIIGSSLLLIRAKDPVREKRVKAMSGHG